MSTAPKRKPAREQNPTPEPPDILSLRHPPQNLDAEKGVLGGLLQCFELMSTVRQFLRTEDFYVSDYGAIYRTMLDLHDAGKSEIDVVVLIDELKRRGEPEKVWADDLMAQIVAAAPTHALTVYHAQIVVEKARAMGALNLSKAIAEDVYGGKKTSEDILASAEAAIQELKLRLLGPGDEDAVCLADIEPEELEWLWPGRVALGDLTTFAGPGGVGKTYVTQDFAARLTTNRPCAGCTGLPPEDASVVYLSTENRLTTSVVPRLIRLGADRNRIYTMPTRALVRWTLSDVATLERVVNAAGNCKLVVIDPPSSHLGAASENSNAEVRALLAPLQVLAARRNLAIVMITHISKSKAEGAANRIMGSVAWVNAARAAWLFKKDSEDKSRRLMLPVKANDTPDMSGLAYRIKEDSGVVAWEDGSVDFDADEACAQEAGRNGSAGQKAQEAAEWLREFLAEYAKPSEVVFASGQAARFPKKALYKAKDILSIKASPKGFRGAWFWGLGKPDDWMLDPATDEGEAIF